MGFGVWGLGFGVWGLGFGVWGLGFVFLGGGWGLPQHDARLPVCGHQEHLCRHANRVISQELGQNRGRVLISLQDLGSGERSGHLRLDWEFAVPTGPAERSFRVTSLIRNSAPLGPYSRTMPRASWRSLEGVLFLVSEIPMYGVGRYLCKGTPVQGYLYSHAKRVISREPGAIQKQIRGQTHQNLCY